eukprot:Gregarina_sp_Poly_1__3067@NODE_1863_length_3170_cov_75_754431_g1208_i0_p1_GENE_NODE_1863_length_3170_cov_75_754431_g1208_i0NODE_1863_length_3170_cov_75_754431_g1208_i0_p1_ORF_typecomplete_len505_score60_63Integrin_beta/PF00362_18/0_23Integrin_beta/PF00362_18/0_6Asp2/PF16929_5/0_042_NODE_1863_length_3170_cov_75_754431_g1208_i015523066
MTAYSLLQNCTRKMWGESQRVEFVTGAFIVPRTKMNSLRIVVVHLILVLGCWSAYSAQDYEIHLTLLQDAASTMQNSINLVALGMSQIVPEIAARATKLLGAEVRVLTELSSFSEKPIPCRGFTKNIGNGAATGNKDAYGFQRHSALSEDYKGVIRGLTRMAEGKNLIYTVDPHFTNSLEALIFTASNISRPASERTKVLRIGAVFTISLPRVEGEGWNAIHHLWNFPRIYPTELGGKKSTGGFGAHDFASHGCVFAWGQDLLEYAELADLNYQLDQGATLDSAQQKRWNRLNRKFGPEGWPETLVRKHPGDASLPCGDVEYPSIELTGTVLREADISPIFFVYDTHLVASIDLVKRCRDAGYEDYGTPCKLALHRQYLTDMRVNGGVAYLSTSNVAFGVINAVMELLEALKLETTTETPTTELELDEITTKAPMQTNPPLEETEVFLKTTEVFQGDVSATAITDLPQLATRVSSGIENLFRPYLCTELMTSIWVISWFWSFSS